MSCFLWGLSGWLTGIVLEWHSCSLAEVIGTVRLWLPLAVRSAMTLCFRQLASNTLLQWYSTMKTRLINLSSETVCARWALNYQCSYRAPYKLHSQHILDIQRNPSRPTYGLSTIGLLANIASQSILAKIVCWKNHESRLSIFCGSAGPLPQRISRSLATAEFSMKSFTLFMLWRVIEACSQICYRYIYNLDWPVRSAKEFSLVRLDWESVYI